VFELGYVGPIGNEIKLSPYRIRLSSGKVHCVVWQIMTDVSDELTEAIVRKLRSVSVHQTSRCYVAEDIHTRRKNLKPHLSR
jgi:hypothetical protein